MNAYELIDEARGIAGCLWDDCGETDPIRRCLSCADAAPLGSDGDYTDSERNRLRDIAAKLSSARIVARTN
jgi:hypothetical protein